MRAYLLASAALLAFVGWAMTRGCWAGDFWEHAAVVDELSRRPLDPHHPILGTEAPHAFFSPWAVVVALAASAADLDATTTLGVAGLANTALLLVALWWFASAVSSDPRLPSVALALTLFLWWPAPRAWSGFLHVGSLARVAPYPSLFAAALVLFGLGALLRGPSRRRDVALLVALTLLLLTHPTSAIALGVGLLLQRVRLWWVVGVSAAIALSWPYFPLGRLLLFEGRPFHAANLAVYWPLSLHASPALLGVPGLLRRRRADPGDPLFLLSAGLAAVFVVGGVGGLYGLGRVLPFLVVVLHLCAAESLLGGAPRWRWVAALVVALALYNTAVALRPCAAPPDLSFLPERADPGELVLTDLETGWRVPSTGARVVASLHPLAFVPDQETRRADVDRFFDGAATEPERQAVLRKYRPSLILIDRSSPAEAEIRREAGGEVAYESRAFVLLRLRPRSRTSALRPRALPAEASGTGSP